MNKIFAGCMTGMVLAVSAVGCGKWDKEVLPVVVTTPGVTPPTVISTVPVNASSGVMSLNSKLSATFSTPMSAATITGTTFLLAGPGVTPVTGTVSYAGSTATFAPSALLTASTLYTATIKGGASGAQNAALVPMAADYVWTFTTGTTSDLVAPTVVSTFPLDLATAVALNTNVTGTFSKAMDPATITASTFTLAGPGPSAIAGVVNYDAVSMLATFNPTSNLLANTTYTATLKGGLTGAKDLTGNALALDKVWSFTTGTVAAPGGIVLGSAGTFGIMATAAITNTGATIINGDVSLNPGSSMTGFPPGKVNGSIHINDTVAKAARVDLLTAYNQAKNLPPGVTISAGADLGALYLTGIPPGTYTSGSSMLVSTPLKLDAGGNANAVWVFQIGSSLTTTANVTLANGAQAKNVFWVPTLDATIGVTSTFSGTIVSGRDVTGKTGAVINGRILAGATLAGTIALDTNTVNVPAP